MLRRAFVLSALAACGTVAERPAAPPAPPRFADRDPVDWLGRGPHDHDVHGIDVSRFQSGLDWHTARASGVSFAFIKATEGGDRVDPHFDMHWAGAGRAGVPRGAYHFHYFCRPASEQAEWFIRNVPRTPGTLPPVLDLEWNPFSPTCTWRPPPETVRAEAEVFLDRLERHYGQRPIIYTTPDFHDANGIDRIAAEKWLRATARHPSHVYPGQPWRFWQYTATAQVPGIGGDVDLNAFSGSRADWAAWLARRRIR